MGGIRIRVRSLDTVKRLLVVGLLLALAACSGGVGPTISSFTATPDTINSGQTSTLAWTVTGDAPITLTIDQGVGAVTGQTSVSVSPAATTSYTLTAKNTAGETTAQTTVTVNPVPESAVDLVVGTYNFGPLLEQTLTAVSIYFNLNEADLPGEDVTLSITGPAGWNGGDAFELTASPEGVASGWLWGAAFTSIVSGEYRLEAQISGETYSASSSPDINQLLPVPQNITVDSATTTSVSGSWNAVVGAKSYRPTLYQAPVELDAEVFGTQLTTDLNVTFDDLSLPPDDYFLGVLAFNIDRTVSGQPEKPVQFNVSIAVSDTFTVGGGGASLSKTGVPTSLRSSTTARLVTPLR